MLSKVKADETCFKAWLSCQVAVAVGKRVFYTVCCFLVKKHGAYFPTEIDTK